MIQSHDHLTHLTEDVISWKLSSLNGKAIVRDQRYFIELMGLEGIQTYTPLRVLRQFDQVQYVPLKSQMTLFKDD